MSYNFKDFDRQFPDLPIRISASRMRAKLHHLHPVQSKTARNSVNFDYCGMTTHQPRHTRRLRLKQSPTIQFHLNLLADQELPIPILHQPLLFLDVIFKQAHTCACSVSSSGCLICFFNSSIRVANSNSHVAAGAASSSRAFGRRVSRIARHVFTNVSSTSISAVSAFTP